jgi:hypothetical protein
VTNNTSTQWNILPIKSWFHFFILNCNYLVLMRPYFIENLFQLLSLKY